MSVVDASYYELLAVATSATASEIKKGYYKQARRWHPDKNPDDPQADAKFKEICEAYRVLSDTDLRSAYNKFGKGAVSGGDGQELDKDSKRDLRAIEMFNRLFGAGEFEDFIGDRLSVFEETSPHASAMQIQEERIRSQKFELELRSVLATKLVDRCKSFMEGDEEAFAQACCEDYHRLSKAPGGKKILKMLAFVYTSSARQKFKGNFGFRASKAKWKAARRSEKDTLQANRLSREVHQLQIQLKRARQRGDADAVASLSKEIKEHGLGALYMLGKRELEIRLMAVCDIAAERVRQRALLNAFITMGRIFNGEQHYGKPHSSRGRKASVSSSSTPFPGIPLKQCSESPARTERGSSTSPVTSPRGEDKKSRLHPGRLFSPRRRSRDGSKSPSSSLRSSRESGENVGTKLRSSSTSSSSSSSSSSSPRRVVSASHDSLSSKDKVRESALKEESKSRNRHTKESVQTLPKGVPRIQLDEL